jgi:hypothetical protein
MPVDPAAVAPVDEHVAARPAVGRDQSAVDADAAAVDVEACELRLARGAPREPDASRSAPGRERRDGDRGRRLQIVGPPFCWTNPT